MTKFVSAVVAVALAAGTAAAQSPAPGELPLTNYLEKRVPEELAAEGKLLSRQNLALKVDQAGGVLIVSLVALDTGRVAASTKVDQVPPDREAAVASITHIAADLVIQLAGRPMISEDAQAVLDAQQRGLDEERKARQQDRAVAEEREVASMKFQKEMIRFTATYSLYATKDSAALVRSWVPYRGELEQHLEAHDFYNLVGRPDLVEAYDHRRNLMIGWYVAGAALIVTGGVLFAQIATVPDCELGDPDFGGCIKSRGDERTQWALAGLGVATLGIGAGMIGTWYRSRPHPITEDEAKSLAAAYNDGLRRNYGLPIVKRPLLRDVRIAPFLASSEGGLSLAGRF